MFPALSQNIVEEEFFIKQIWCLGLIWFIWLVTSWKNCPGELLVDALESLRLLVWLFLFLFVSLWLSGFVFFISFLLERISFSFDFLCLFPCFFYGGIDNFFV